MKKIIALTLAILMVMSMVACGNTKPETTEPSTEAPTTEATTPETEPTETEPTEEATEPSEETNEPTTEETASVKIMNDIWALFTEENKPFVMGGGPEVFVDNAPGALDLTDPTILMGILYVPEAQLANVDEAATAMHAMMANNFTAGVMHVTGDVTAFANAQLEALQNNHWMCGIPETLVVAVVNGEYVVAGFGAADMMSVFATNLTTAYADAQVVYNGALSA
jgi:predicted small lipoprotein YifL